MWGQNIFCPNKVEHVQSLHPLNHGKGGRGLGSGAPPLAVGFMNEKTKATLRQAQDDFGAVNAIVYEDFIESNRIVILSLSKYAIRFLVLWAADVSSAPRSKKGN